MIRSLSTSFSRLIQTHSHARNCRLPEESRIRSRNSRAYAHSRNMAKVAYTLQPRGSRRTGTQTLASLPRRCSPANSTCLQENAVILDKNEDDDEENEKYWPYEPPNDVFGEMMFERRLAAEGSSSPVTSRHAESRRGSTVADTDGKS